MWLVFLLWVNPLFSKTTVIRNGNDWMKYDSTQSCKKQWILNCLLLLLMADYGKERRIITSSRSEATEQACGIPHWLGSTICWTSSEYPSRALGFIQVSSIVAELSRLSKCCFDENARFLSSQPKNFAMVCFCGFPHLAVFSDLFVIV